MPSFPLPIADPLLRWPFLLPWRRLLQHPAHLCRPVRCFLFVVASRSPSEASHLPPASRTPRSNPSGSVSRCVPALLEGSSLSACASLPTTDPYRSILLPTSAFAPARYLLRRPARLGPPHLGPRHAQCVGRAQCRPQRPYELHHGRTRHAGRQGAALFHPHLLCLAVRLETTSAR
jgi:hypothetical protein